MLAGQLYNKKHCEKSPQPRKSYPHLFKLLIEHLTRPYRLSLYKAFSKSLTHLITLQKPSNGIVSIVNRGNTAMATLKHFLRGAWMA